MKKPLYHKNKKHLAIDAINKHWQIGVPKLDITVFKNCLITPTNHLFVKGRYIPTGIIKPHDDKKLSLKQKIRLITKSVLFNNRTRLSQPHIWAYDEWSKNYYHWMCETLPRILQCHIRFPSSPILITEELGKIHFVKESLKILKLPIVYINPANSIFSNSIITTLTTPMYGNIIPKIQIDLVSELRRQIESHNFSEPECIAKRIYISRKHASLRKIVNEQELIPIIERYNYRVIFNEQLSLTEQFQIFSQTKHLIALHGAGQTNIMFMPKDSFVLELRNKKIESQPLCYFELSNACSIQWDYYMGEPINEETNFNNIYVDPKEFEDTLRKIHLKL